MVEKILHYKIEGDIAQTIRKVLANISDLDLRGKFGLSDKEISNVNIYLDNVDMEEVEDDKM